MNKAKLAGVVIAAACAFEAVAATRTVEWELPANWANGLEIAEVDGFGMIRADGLGSRSGLGEVGEPNLPFKAFSIDVKKGGAISAVACDVEWVEVKAPRASCLVHRANEGVPSTKHQALSTKFIPFPIVSLVKVGDPIVMPELSAAYQTVYPTNQVDVGDRQIFRNQESFTLRVTPFKWDGTTHTLYRACKLKVKVEVEEKTSLQLQTSNLKLQTSSANVESAANFIILAPHKFYDLWCAYAEFRRHSKGGQGLTFMVKDLNDLYENNYKPSEHINGYTKKPDYELCIHKWLEDMYAQKEKVKVEGEDEKEVPILKYILLGGTPAKYEFNAEEHIPSRRFAAVATNGYLSDAYYGCMDKKDKSGNATTEGEVWDYECDGVYMAELQSAGWIKCYDAVTKSVDWDPDVSVFRFPLMSAVKDGTGAGVYQTAEQIMDTFTNRIAWAESDDFPEEKRNIYANTGGHMHKSWNRGATFSEVNGEHEFFEGRLNVFDPSHPTPFMDSEIYSRHHVPDYFSVYRGWKDNSTIHTCNYNPNTYADIYANSGEIVNNLAHGWARGADPMSAPQAYSATGFYRAYIIGNSCDCGMFDYCPDGSYGITNCICVGEAPILNPNPHCGALVSYTNARFGYGDSYTWYGSDCMDHFLNAGWAGTDEYGNSIGEMNGGEAHLFACKKFQQYGNPKCSEVNGVCEMEIICHGDPLVRLSPETNAVNSTDFICVRDFYFDAANGIVSFAQDSTSAGFYVNGDNNCVKLVGASVPLARYRSTRETVLTNVSELVWEIEGGAGRRGVTFVGNRGKLTLPGTAKRYFGQAFKNVGEISVSGGNATLDFPQSGSVADCADFERLSFVAGELSSEENFNILRTRQKGFFPAGQNLVVVSNRLDLQTANIGAPIYATNAVIKVSPNPNWSGETFTQKVELVDSELRSNSDNFYFAGTPDLFGAVKFSGMSPIRLSGANTLALHEGATLDVSASIQDGTSAGSLMVRGAGTVRFSTAAAHTLGTTIDDGATLEVAEGGKMPGDTAVAAGGKLRPLALPMSGAKTITVASGATLSLPAGLGKNGIYQLVNPLTATITIDSGATVVDETTGEAITGTIKNGCFLSDAEALTWNGAQGAAWDFTHANWKDGASQSAKYQNGYPLAFKDIGSQDDVRVTLDADVAPGFMDFQNTKPYRFDARERHSIDIGSLVTETDIGFGSNVTVKSETLIAASKGNLALGDVETPELQMAEGTSLRVTGTARAPIREIKKLRFTFTQAYKSSERVAIAELHLFIGGEMMTIPQGTIIRDSAGQEIEVGEPSGSGYNYTWLKGQGLYSDNESLKALIDGKLDGNNKWWLSNKAYPVWFELEFPETQTEISAYRFHMADYGVRNPKAWSISCASDAESTDYKTIRNCSYDDGNKQHWYPAMPILDAGGSVTVMGGAKLYASGAYAADLVLQDGAILAVTNDAALSKSGTLMVLSLPADGKVTVDVSEAEKHTDWKPLLVGFGLTEAEFLKFACADTTAALKLEDGDIYLVTDGVAQSPFSATLADGEADWSALTWTDSTGATFSGWAALNARSDGEAVLNVTGDATLVADVGGSFGMIRVTGEAGTSLTIVTNGVSDVMTPVTFDASDYKGALRIEMPLGTASVIAGPDTTLAFGAVQGNLTMGAGSRVTLAEGTTIAPEKLTMDETAELRQLGTRGAVTMADFPKGVYSFENATLTNGLMNANVAIRVTDEDRVVIYGLPENDSGNNRFSYVVEGGEVVFQPNVPTMEWGGNLTLTGGRFTFAPTIQGDSGMLNLKGGAINVSSGVFDAAGSVLTLKAWTTFVISDGAVFKAYGFTKDDANGSVQINNATLEIGANGMDYETVGSFAMNGGELLATGAGATFAQEITATGDITIAAKDGASMLMNRVEDGSGVVTFGKAGGGFDGTIQFKGSYSVPAQYKVVSGTLNHVNTKFSDASHVLVEKSAAGATILCDVLDSDMKVDTYKNILYCGSWVASLTDAEIKAFVNIRAPIGVLDDDNWIINRSNNFVQFKAMLIQNNSSFIGVSGNWSEMDWKNNFGGTFSKAFWTSDQVADAYVTYTQTSTGIMTLDTDVAIGLMQITIGMNGNPTINANGHRFTVAGSVVLDNTQSYANTKAIRFYGGEITFGSITLNKVNNFELEGTVLGNVSVPSGGTYKQTGGTFGSITLPPTAKAVLGMAIEKGELLITGIEYANGTAENVVLTAKGLVLDDPNASFANATVEVTADLAYARLLSLAETMRITTDKFTFDDDVTLDVGTVRDATNLPTNCYLKFQLTAAEMANVYAGVAVYTAEEGKVYSPEKISVVDDTGAPLIANVTFENGKILVRKTFGGGAICATVAADLSDIRNADWRDANGRVLGTFDWSLVTDMTITNAAGVTLTIADVLTIPGTFKMYSVTTKVVTLQLNADFSAGSVWTDSADGNRCSILARGSGAWDVTDEFVLGGYSIFQLSGSMSVCGIRDTEATDSESKFQNCGTLTLGGKGVNMARAGFTLLGSQTIAQAGAMISSAVASKSYGQIILSAAAGKTLTLDEAITEPYKGYNVCLIVQGEGTVALMKDVTASGGIAVQSGTLDVGTMRMSNVVTLSGGKVKVSLTPTESEQGGLIELFGFTGSADDLKAKVTVKDGAGKSVEGYFKVLNSKAYFGLGEEGILQIAVGKTVTLSSQGDYTNIKGGGTLVCNGFWPNFSNLADANCWTGTVKMAGSPSQMKYYTFANLGNASSVIEIAGTVYGYLAVGGKCTSALKVTGTLHINNGNSGASYEFAGPLSGEGLIKTTKPANTNPTTKIYFTGDTSAFAGTVNVAGGHCVLFVNATSVASSAGKIVVSGKTITIPFGKTWSAVNGIEVKSGATVRCDLGEVTGKELATRAVAGVPYAMTYFVGSVSGEGAIVASGLPSGQPLPRGYSLAVSKTSSIAVVVTAPDTAKFGAISVNIRNGNALESTETLSGLYPVARKYWGDLQAAKDKSITISNATFKISSTGTVSAYGLDNTPPDMIYKQYMDDNATTRTITITGVPYDQYRLVVYYSTDTANYNFRPLNVNGDWYAGALASQNTANPTVKGRNEVWGHSGANHNANNPVEGVNALFTDVYSGDVTLSFTRNGGTGARATPCAVQIIKVGEVYREPLIYYLQ